MLYEQWSICPVSYSAKYVTMVRPKPNLVFGPYAFGYKLIFVLLTLDCGSCHNDPSAITLASAGSATNISFGQFRYGGSTTTNENGVKFIVKMTLWSITR